MERIVVCTTEGGFPAIDTMVLLARGEGAQSEWEATCDPESLFEGTFGPPGDGLWIWEGDPIWNAEEGRRYFNRRFEWRRPTRRELPALSIGALPWTPTIAKTFRCTSCGAGFVTGGEGNACVDCGGKFRKVPCNCDENCDEPYCLRHDWDKFVENWGGVDEALEQMGWK
jgi:hypothetical protein